jgi:hypothetical protein
VPDEQHSEVLSLELPLHLELSLTAGEIAHRFSGDAESAMQRDPSLRSHLVRWKVDAAQSCSELRPRFSTGLQLLWDGLRRLPYADGEVAGALGNWVALYCSHFDEAPEHRGQREAFEGVFGASMRIEFGAVDGSSAIGFASARSLRRALRPDLHEVLADDALHRSADLKFLLQVIVSPRHFCDFNQLGLAPI